MASHHLIPALLGRDWWDVWDFPRSLFDQHFGLGLTDDDVFSLRCPYQRGFLEPAYRPRRWLVRPSPGSGASEVKSDPDKFQVMLDVHHFKPEEIEVKTVGDNSLVIHAKHEEKADEHGFIYREFTRRYVLPEGVDPKEIQSSLKPNGVLAIEAPRKRPEQPPGVERSVPIQVTHVGRKPVTGAAQEAEKLQEPKSEEKMEQ